MDFKRGVSAKDLRPFSVDDPLGQKPPRRQAAPDPATQLAGPVADMMAPARAVMKMVRVGCLLAAAVWLMGMAASAVSWLPELIDELRPLIDRVLAELELEQGSTDAVATDPDVVPAPAQSEPPAAPEPAPEPAEPPSALATATPAPGSDSAELARVCERTVQCCLTVQGERARHMCERFRQMPMADPCVQAYDAFARYGGQIGKPCQE